MDSFYDVPRRAPAPVASQRILPTTSVPEVSILSTSKPTLQTGNNGYNNYVLWTNKENLHAGAYNFNNPVEFPSPTNTSQFRKQVRFESPVLQQRPSLTYEPFIPRKPEHGSSTKTPVTPAKIDTRKSDIPPMGMLNGKPFEQIYMANVPNRSLDLSIIDTTVRMPQNNTQKDKKKELPKTYREFLHSQKSENDKTDLYSYKGIPENEIQENYVTDLLNYRRGNNKKLEHNSSNKNLTLTTPKTSKSKEMLSRQTPIRFQNRVENMENNNMQFRTDNVSSLKELQTPKRSQHQKGRLGNGPKTSVISVGFQMPNGFQPFEENMIYNEPQSRMMDTNYAASQNGFNQPKENPVPSNHYNNNHGNKPNDRNMQFFNSPRTVNHEYMYGRNMKNQNQQKYNETSAEHSKGSRENDILQTDQLKKNQNPFGINGREVIQTHNSKGNQHSPMGHPYSPMGHPHSPMGHPNSHMEHTKMSQKSFSTDSREDIQPMGHPNSPMAHPNSSMGHPHSTVQYQTESRKGQNYPNNHNFNKSHQYHQESSRDELPDKNCYQNSPKMHSNAQRQENQQQYTENRPANNVNQLNKSPKCDMDTQTSMIQNERTVATQNEGEPTVKDLLKIITHQNEQLLILQKQVAQLIDRDSSAKQIEGPSENPPNRYNTQDKYVTSTQHENYRNPSDNSNTPRKRGAPKFAIDLTTNFEISFRRQNNQEAKIQEITESGSNINTIDTRKCIDDINMEDLNLQTNNSFCGSPEPSIRIDMADYDNSDDEEVNESDLGATFYRKVVGTVNHILKKAQIKTSDDCNGQRNAGVSEKTKDKIKEATLRHLESIGVFLPASEDTVDSTSPNNESKDYNPKDVSYLVKQLLMKYLPDDHLAKITYKQTKTVPVNDCKDLPDFISKRPDFSFATLQYMKKYNLLNENPKETPVRPQNKKLAKLQNAESPQYLENLSSLKHQPKLA